MKLRKRVSVFEEKDVNIEIQPEITVIVPISKDVVYLLPTFVVYERESDYNNYGPTLIVEVGPATDDVNGNYYNKSDVQKYIVKTLREFVDNNKAEVKYQGDYGEESVEFFVDTVVGTSLEKLKEAYSSLKADDVVLFRPVYKVYKINNNTTIGLDYTDDSNSILQELKKLLH